jgi:hypothetical protein
MTAPMNWLRYDWLRACKRHAPGHDLSAAVDASIAFAAGGDRQGAVDYLCNAIEATRR